MSSCHCDTFGLLHLQCNAPQSAVALRPTHSVGLRPTLWAIDSCMRNVWWSLLADMACFMRKSITTKRCHQTLIRTFAAFGLPDFAVSNTWLAVTHAACACLCLPLACTSRCAAVDIQAQPAAPLVHARSISQSTLQAYTGVQASICTFEL